MSPDYAWWYRPGPTASIRHEDQRIREAETARKRTLFMLATGPLMVLAVLAAVYLGWRGWRRGRGPCPA